MALELEFNGIRDLHKTQKTFLGFMMMHHGEERFRHSHYQGASTWHFKQLDQYFGRSQFIHIMKHINELNREPKDQPNQGGIFDVRAWSKSQGFTRAVYLTPKAAKFRHNYWTSVNKPRTRLVHTNGRYMKTPPTGMLSQDLNQSTVEKIQIDSSTPVNISALNHLIGQLREVLLNWDQGVLPETQCANPKTIKYWLEEAGKYVTLANNDVKDGCVFHTYKESQSGRLYSGGLQSCPLIVRQAALKGFYAYDFENCHYAIFSQLAKQRGIICNAIDQYLTHKDEIRTKFASDLGITKEQAKEMLIAMIYGARSSKRPQDAIPEIVGVGVAEKAYKTTMYQDLSKDIKRGRKAILEACQTRQRGHLINAFNKTINCSDSVEQKLAHILQGVERLLLNIVNQTLGGIVLYEHDGFTIQTPIDKVALESKIFATTGFQMRLKETKIDVDFAGCCLRGALSRARRGSKRKNSFKLENSPTANNDEPFGELPYS